MLLVAKLILRPPGLRVAALAVGTALLALALAPAGASAACGRYSAIGTGTGCTNGFFACCGVNYIACDGGVPPHEPECTAACGPFESPNVNCVAGLQPGGGELQREQPCRSLRWR